MNREYYRFPDFGTTIINPDSENWVFRTEFHWQSQLMISLTRKLKNSDEFLKIILHCLRERDYEDLTDFAKSFPTLQGKTHIPVIFNSQQALLFQNAVKINTDEREVRFGIDRHYLVSQDGDYAAFVVWNSPGLFEQYSREIEDIQTTLGLFLN
jgi:hypothetical protein